MTKIYERNRMVGGVPTLDIVMLHYPPTCDCERVLHTLGIQYCMTKEGTQRCRDNGGITMEQLLDYITPEILEPYGITMVRPRETAIQLNQERLVISRYEMDTYLNLRDTAKARSQKLYDISRRFARRLESQRANGHPVVSTWNTEKVSAQAIMWANQCIKKSKSDITQFFQDKLDELTPDMRGNHIEPLPLDETVADQQIAAQ